ncbi:IS3 family transposase [Streptomyces lannensis]|uniref:IS3 family transposase n=1 Tax=Streptomyces lannensis TaxID=766498 RepID=UPI003CD05E8F
MLAGEIRGVHGQSGGACGSPRITAELREKGRRVNTKWVARGMRTLSYRHSPARTSAYQRPGTGGPTSPGPVPAGLHRSDREAVGEAVPLTAGTGPVEQGVDDLPRPAGAPVPADGGMLSLSEGDDGLDQGPLRGG